MHIVDMVYFWARTMPRRPAVIQPEGIITYGALAQGIEAAAEYFAGHIADRSKPVTVALTRPPKTLVASLGLMRAGFDIIVAMKNEVPHVPAGGSSVLVYERGEAALEDRTNIVFDDSWLEVGANAPRAFRRLTQPRTSNTDVHFFTSGTTGRPKRIVRTRRGWDQRILFNGTSAFQNYERVVLSMGASNAMGFTRCYEVLYAGKTVCFAPLGQAMLWLVNTYDIDLIMASPQQVLGLAELQEKVTRYPLEALKTVSIGGSILSPDGLARIRNYLCRNIVLNYSSTEAGIAAIAPYDMIEHIPSAVGYVIPGTEIQIVDADDNILPIGTEGFVRLRTAQFLENFAIDEPNRWYYPGDVGWLTEDGVLCIAGRKGDVVNRGGVKLSVTDFENFLRSCPGVNDAGVCTLMGASGIDEIWIGLVLEPSVDIGSLRQSIEGNTDFGRNLDKLFVVEAIPRGALGKIQREELKKLLQGILEERESSN
jgi:acyl-coenzyme A synthetase/AMP-(fatty) acid ligase